MIGPLRFVDDFSFTCTYLVGDEKSGTAVLIDPIREHMTRDLAMLAALRLRLVWVIETHVHAGETSTAARLAAMVGARSAAPAARRGSDATRTLRDRDRLFFGGSHVEALLPQGADADGVCLLLRPSDATPHLFIGDTWLTDLKIEGGGEHLGNRWTRLLPGDARVWPGHHFGGCPHPKCIGDVRRQHEAAASRSRDVLRGLMSRLRPLKAALREGSTSSIAPENRISDKG